MAALFQFDGLSEFRDELRKVRDALSDLQPFLTRVAIALRRGFAEMFNSEGRAGGDPWQPLAPSTIAAKQRLFEMGAIRGRVHGVRARLRAGEVQAGSLPGILIRTGALKDSVARRGVRGNIHRVAADGKSIQVGSSLPYAAVHEYGGAAAYTIAPVNKPFLAWFGIKRDGTPGWVYASQVRHPPLPRRSYLVVTPEAWDEIMNLTEELLSGQARPSEGGE
jgi:phage gpG-like protein